jgi:hypothetical protein
VARGRELWVDLLLAVGVAGPAALLFRRRRPLGVLAVACGLAYAARTYPEGPSQLAIYPALWTVALTVPPRPAWLAAGVTALAATGPSWSSSPTSPAWSAPGTWAELRPPP